MNKERIITVLLVIFIIVALFAFADWRSGNVIAEYQESYNVNDPLSGNFVINIEKGDSIDANSPILVSLSKGNNELVVKTLTFGEFISLSDNPVNPITKNAGEFFEQPGRHSVEINKIIDYKFTEKGDYELFFNLFKLDLTIKKKITVN